MKKINIKNLGALATAVALTTTLCSCNNGKVVNNNIEDENDFQDSSQSIVEVDDERTISDIDVVTAITDDDKPFRLKESFLDENNNLVYQEFGPLFYEKEIDGLKYLINAETKEVCLRGYNNLGRLCCLKCLKSENGGVDSDNGYSGYVLLAIYNIEGRNLFSLYDFDDFTPLLDKCDLSGSTSFTNDVFNIYYLAPYDPKYRGCDEENEYTGYFFRVEKDDICYFVDANDFKKIILSGDFTFYDVNISSTGNASVSFYDYDSHEDRFYTSEDLVPTYSDVLQKTFVKNTEN